jgi:ketosteroid isomerase-like protein
MIEQTKLLDEVEAQTQTSADSRLIQRIIDEAKIRRIVDEIDDAVDAKDWSRCRQFFMDDINVDFSSLTGGQPALIKSDELVGAWRTNLYADKKSHHMRSNHRITINGDKAEVFSKGYAFNQLMMKTGGDLWEVWGDYRHILEQTEQGWKVSGMSLSVTHARGNERTRDFVPAK